MNASNVNMFGATQIQYKFVWQELLIENNGNFRASENEACFILLGNY